MQFEPPIPESYQQKIDRMGNGMANKIVVSVEEPFW